jgi:vitamin B12 transporter
LRAPVFYIALLITISAFGQASFMPDTIRINEVEVKGSLLLISSEGYKHDEIDSAVLKEYTLGNLSEMVSENTPVYIKSYGAGGTATTSIRGTGANHTQLAWNGININSPMLGQADLSLIPAGFLDNVRIYSGGASMGLNCGGIGGIINIETEPDWKSNGNISATIGAGSFNRYTGMIKARTGNKNFQSVTKIYMQSAENDFRYLNNVSNTDPVYERRTNAQVRQTAFLQELYLRKGSSVTSARVWYQMSDRNLPASMLAQQPEKGESQLDEFFRAAMDYNHYSRTVDYDISASWFSDRLNYFNPDASIDSRNHSNTFIARGEIGYIPGGKTRIKFILTNELNLVKSVNYSNQKIRNLSTFIASIRRALVDKVSTYLLVTQILNDRHLLIPDFLSGIDLKPVDSREYYLRINFARNSKIPSLNDMYWNPGGNPDLKNEFSYSGEASWQMKGTISGSVDWDTELTFFSNDIIDMIQWGPTQFSYWSPSNIARVKTTGLEAGTNLFIKANKFTVKVNGHYTLTSARTIRSGSVDIVSDKQLLYVPQNQFNAGIRLNFRYLYSSWITSFTGRRFITPDNSQYLPGYILSNFISGVKIKSGRNSLDINFKIDNIFGVNYQAISYYPMPGRVYIFSISYQLTKL